MSNTRTLDYPGGATDNSTMHRGAKAVVAGVMGHILEWYDFAVYGYLALHIAGNFFPSDDKTASLLASLATFGIGFVARPAGGIFFGRIGDRYGRKVVLLWTLLMMGSATLLIGLVPTYDTIGRLAPILLVAARLAQGFSAGGETTAAAAFIVEWAPPKRRGLYGSFQQVGSAAGLLLGTLVVAGLSSTLSASSMTSWGWRVPFLIGIVLAPIGFLIRSRVDETPVFRARPVDAHTVDARGEHFTMLTCKAFMFALFWCVGFYFFLSYMPTFAQRELKLPASTVYWISSLGSVVYMCAIPLFGHLSDRIGRKPVLMFSCGGFTFGLLPLFHSLASNPSPGFLLLVIAICATFLAAYTGPAAATLSEFFATHNRSSGMALGYSMSSVVFGGFTPFIATWLIAFFGTPMAPIYYVMLSAAVGGIFVVGMRETSHDDLE